MLLNQSSDTPPRKNKEAAPDTARHGQCDELTLRTTTSLNQESTLCVCVRARVHTHMPPILFFCSTGINQER